jgi:pyridoxine 5-phosphate synthase
LKRDAEFLQPIIAGLKHQAIRVSLFVDPDPEAPGAARALGADRIELYTGPYGGAHDDPRRESEELAKLEMTAAAAAKAGIAVNAGHDLTVANLPALVKKVPNLVEVSIGHGLTADALVHGMSGAVERFLDALKV